jgi:hypothetical protein
MYETVFDVRQSFPESVPFVLVMGLVFAGFGVLLLRSGAVRRWLALTWITVCAVLFMLLATVGIDQWLTYRSMLRTGACAVVEGEIREFDPMPYSGHKLESFTVQGVRFSYSDYVLSPAFNRSRSHGGLLHEGLQVRIAYVSGESDHPILKLDIPSEELRHASPQAAPVQPVFTPPVFIGFWVVLGGLSSALLYWSKNVVWKRRLYPLIVLVSGVAFALFGWQVVGVPGLIVPVVLISFLNYRNTRFCAACGATVHGRWKRPLVCTECNVALE